MIVEKRRNPEFNQKISAMDALEKYAGQDVFVTFTADVGTGSHIKNYKDYDIRIANKSGKTHNASGPKIGINPSTQYATPIGIYAYPIEYVLKNNMKVPFAGGKPYIWVFKPTGKMLNLEKYTSSDLKSDLAKLEKLGGSYRINTALHSALVQTPGGKIWNATRIVAHDKTETRLRDKAEAERDEGYDERYEKAFEDFYRWTWEKDEDDPDDEQNARDEFDFEDDDYDTEPHEKDIEEKAPPMWNAILQKLGYVGVVDYEGEGIIHENEPTQAVFFSKKDIKVLELIDNITPNQPKSREDIWNAQPKALIALMKNGRITDEEIIVAIDRHPYLISKIGFSLFPEGVKRYIRDHANEIFYNAFGNLKPQELGLSDEQTIELLAEQPGWATTYDTLTPVVKKYIVDHIREFAEHFDRLPFTDAEKATILTHDPSIYTWISKSNPSPFLQKYMLQYHPNDLLEHIWSHQTTTETFVGVFVKVVMKSSTKYMKTQFLDRLLRYDNDNSPDFKNFIACFAKLPSPQATVYLRNILSNTGDWRVYDIVKPHYAELKQKMIQAKPAIAKLFEPKQNPTTNAS